MSQELNNEDEKTINGGLEFRHGTNGEYEFYAHTDHNGVIWQVWRHLREPETGWYASVHQPGPGGVDAVLNTLIHNQERSEIKQWPDLNGDPDSSILLCGIVALIKADHVPLYESYNALLNAPVITQGEAEEITVERYVKCEVCEQVYSLKIDRADEKRFLHKKELIQDIFPYLAPPMRELLVSGVCPKCWLAMFGSPHTSSQTLDGDREGKGE